MSGIANFNFKDFKVTLKKSGLEKTWINLLATHISYKPRFNYILDSSEFKGYKLFKKD